MKHLLIIVIIVFSACGGDKTANQPLAKPKPDTARKKPPIARIAPVAPLTLYGEANLDARKSFDPDGRIIKWKWTQLSGPTQVMMVDRDSPVCHVDGLIQGYYDFLIQVTDDSLATSSKKVVVAVGPPTP